MLTGHQSKTFTRAQLWWREARLPKVEEMAYDLIRRHESKYGRLQGYVVQPEVLLPTVGCDLVYFGDEDRDQHGIPPDAIGALKPHQRLILIYARIRQPGREQLTIGEEIGHFVLHAKGVASQGQGRLDLDVPADRQSGSLVFHRTDCAGFVDGESEPPWMTREAQFYAACLQMPIDRYLPVAESRLVQATRAWVERHSLPPLEERITQAARKLRAGIEARAQGRTMITAHSADDQIIEDALELLERDHGGLVSKAAQRRRFAELGLAHDAADVFEGRPGFPSLGKGERYFLSARITVGTLQRR